VIVRTTLSFNGSKEQPTRLPRSVGEALSGVETATAVSTDMPGRARVALGSRGLKRMRTVKRRTIFVKLPVSLSGGISVNSHRRRQDRFDIAADRPTGISIDVDTDGIADLHAADLRLAVIGLDPEIVNRDDREHARAGRDVFADAHLAVGDDAVDRRSHRGVYEPWVDVGLLLVDKILGGAVRVETARFIHSDRAASAARYFPGFAPRQTHGDKAVLKAQEWVHIRDGRDVSLASMAEVAGLERRTFLRRFANATGMTPIEYCRTVRIARARELPEGGNTPQKEIANPSGMRTWLHLHASFVRSQGWRRESTERGSALTQCHLTISRKRRLQVPSFGSSRQPLSLAKGMSATGATM